MRTKTMTNYLATTNGDGNAAMTVGIIVVALCIILVLAGLWKTFAKARRAGWMSLIPLLNTYVIIRMAGRPRWWIVLYLIPFVNIVAHLVVSLDLAKRFGKSAWFGVIGLWMFSFAGFLILGFGNAEYRG
jgi:hypothetical protein